jgi:nitrite reductase/ring-hydroxylating ferredoxin subunit
LIIPGVQELLDANKAAIGNRFDEDDMRIVCPWHGVEFSIKTGCHPAKADVKLNAIEVGEGNGEVYVEL